MSFGLKTFIFTPVFLTRVINLCCERRRPSVCLWAFCWRRCQRESSF